MEQENLMVDLFFLYGVINKCDFKVQGLDKIFHYVFVYRDKKPR